MVIMDAEPVRLAPLAPASAIGLRGVWVVRRAVAPPGRGVLTCPRASVRARSRRAPPPKFGSACATTTRLSPSPTVPSRLTRPLPPVVTTSFESTTERPSIVMLAGPARSKRWSPRRAVNEARSIRVFSPATSRARVSSWKARAVAASSRSLTADAPLAVRRTWSKVSPPAINRGTIRHF